MQHADFEVVKVIGRGAFGEVQLVRTMNQSCMYCVYCELGNICQTFIFVNLCHCEVSKS